MPDMAAEEGLLLFQNGLRRLHFEGRFVQVT
jgi:hypothetical protein